MAQLIKGKQLARTMRSKVKKMVADLPIKPGLAVILVGDDPASRLYVNLKKKACREVGINFELWQFPAEAPTELIVKKIRELNERLEINGILVQFPLPQQDEESVIQAIKPEKDVDGFHPDNLRRLEDGEPGLVPPVALGIIKLIETTGINWQGKEAVLVCSDFFARPLATLLKKHGVKSEIKPLERLREAAADIVIVALGQPHAVKPEDVKPGAIVIDVGTTKTPEDLLGDVDPSVAAVAGFLTPVPGGVGPMTVAMLTLNVVKAVRLQARPADGRPSAGRPSEPRF